MIVASHSFQARLIACETADLQATCRLVQRRDKDLMSRGCFFSGAILYRQGLSAPIV
jgi:hypothetical protein